MSAHLPFSPVNNSFRVVIREPIIDHPEIRVGETASLLIMNEAMRIVGLDFQFCDTVVYCSTDCVDFLLN